jgi:group I intron endonuclease
MPKPKRPGIYLIVNPVEDKLYVGSSVNLGRRLYDHQRNLDRGKHSNWELQRAYNKGHPLLISGVIIPDDAIPTKVEQMLLDDLFKSGRLYNIPRDATAPTLGLKSSPETRLKVSLAGKGRKNTPETIEKMRVASIGRNLGMIHSAETRAKKSLQSKGKVHTEESKRNFRLAAIGRKPSVECLQKAAEAKTNSGLPLNICGNIYRSAGEASKITGVQKDTVYYRVNSRSVKFADWQYVEQNKTKVERP